jgi:Zn-dependent protease with chaperone function
MIPALVDRESGTLVRSGQSLHFHFDSGDRAPIELPFNRLQIRIAGENSHHYFLFDRLHPGIEICVQNDEFIETLANWGIPSARMATHEAKGRTRGRFARIGAFAGLLVALFFGIPLILSWAPSSWLNTIVSPDQEEKLGAFVLPLLADIVEEHPALTGVTTLVERLQQTNPALRTRKPKVMISKDREVNAFMLPGGILVMNEGLLQQATSPDEVAGVLAHELGHLELRHNLRALSGSASMLLGLGTLSLVAGPDAALWVSRGANLAWVSHSRREELDADERAFEYLTHAGISPEGLIRFFERLSSSQRSGLIPMLNLFSTHPLAKERARILRSKMK